MDRLDFKILGIDLTISQKILGKLLEEAGECIPYSGFISRAKIFANCHLNEFCGKNFREMTR